MEEWCREAATRVSYLVSREDEEAARQYLPEGDDDPEALRAVVDLLIEDSVAGL